jgi:fermentation-respiration switch protein FrsA (DUF1100 family)
VLAGAAGLSACVMTRPARTPPLPPPADLAVRAVRFASASGSTIRAWYLPGTPGGGAVLLLHGVGSNRGSMVGRARFLHRQGYSVLLPDFQAHGESGGEFITFGSLESLDAAAALEVLRRCASGERVAAIGVSMGGAATLLGRGPLDVDALVLESVYPTIRQALDNRLAVWMGPLGRLNRLVSPVVMRAASAEIGVKEDALRPIDRIAEVAVPLFVLSGTRDAYTPLAEARALFERARGAKEFWAVEGAAHEDLYDFTADAYERRVGGFLATHLHTSPTRGAARSALPDRPAEACVVPSAGEATQTAAASER